MERSLVQIADPRQVGRPTGGAARNQLPPQMQNVGFDLNFARRFWALCRIVLRKRNAVLLLLGLLVLAICYEFVAYQVGLISSKYYVVLGEKDLHGFWMQTLMAVGLIFAISKMRALRTFVANTAGVQWRRILTEDLQGLYFSAKNHYTLNVLETTLDNPDQRMSQDVDRFCRKLAEALPPTFVAPFTTCYYIYKAYQVSGWMGPVSTFLFFMVFTVLNKFLMSPVVPRVYEQEKQEGHFRFEHSRIRAHSESIAFLDGEPVELDNTNGILQKVVKAQQSVVNRQLPVTFGVHMFDYLGSILSLLVIAVPIFNGTYDGEPAAKLAGIISANAFVTIYLISCYSSLVDLSGSVTVIAGNTHRIAALRERLQTLIENNAKVPEIKARDGSAGDDDDVSDEKPSIELMDVTYKSPRDGSVLVDKLTIMLDCKRNVLITGASGTGKTTLLRVIKKLRDIEGGHIRFKNSALIAFMPQIPWLTSGSLRKQIRYPSKDACDHLTDEDAEMQLLLQVTGLKHLLESAYSLDEELDAAWYSALSPGEKQRLSWARLLYHRPRLAFLDEATSALDSDATARLHKECAERGIVTVAVGYERAVEGWEPGLVLELKGDNGYWNVVQKESAA
ncbi:hypothetical protein HPB47_012449 [Ixodes persulcatus]|uniref:Uncharacterized protein n=1 Tax=Ixodes persulcatus TaxID=34615 RepID=A0AC60NTI1_IXOPE|nr:hypothetical protein HPB47_012449 [Ixodes persulcatus]